MPRLASITSQSFTGIVSASIQELLGTYQFDTVTSSNANSVGDTFFQGESVTLALEGVYGPSQTIPDIYWEIENATTDDFAAVSGTASVASLTTLPGVSQTVVFDIDFQIATTVLNADTYILRARESTANGLSIGTYTFVTEQYTPAGLWRDDNSDPVTVRSIISPIAMQVNGAFAVNPVTPFTVQGLSSGAVTTITNISANTGTILEIEDSGNSTSFTLNEQLEII